MSKIRCFIGDHKTFEHFTGDFDHKTFEHFTGDFYRSIRLLKIFCSFIRYIVIFCYL